MKKRIVSIILVLTLTIAALPMFGLSVSAAGLGEYDIYKAAELADTEGYEIFYAWYHTIMSTKPRDEALDEYCDVLLYNHFVDANNRDKISLGAKAIWSAINTDLVLTEEDIYTALLLKMMSCDFPVSTDAFGVFDTFYSGIKDLWAPLMEYLSKYFNAKNIKELENIIDMQEYWGIDDGNAVWAALVDAKDKGVIIEEDWDKVGGVFEIFDKIIEAGKIGWESIETLISIYRLIFSGKEAKLVLNEIANNENNKLLIRAAARRLYSYMSGNEYYDVLNATIEEILCGTFKLSRKRLADTIKGAITTANPALYGTAKVVDELVGIDDEIASTYTMYAMADMESAIFSAVAAVRDDFKANQTLEYASAYKAGLDMCFIFAYQTCDYVDEHLSNLYTKGSLKQFIRDQQNYETYKAALEEARAHIQLSYKQAIDIPSELYNTTLEKAGTDYFVTYNANGGMGEPESQIKKAGVALTLSSVKPTRRGYIFSGWATDPNAAKANYTPGQSYTGNSDLRLYAIWKASTFDIVFHANGGKFSDGGTAVTKQKTYLQNFTINPGQPTREGYKFMGVWSTGSDGTGSRYNHGGTYNDIGGAGANTKHLYAVWQKTDCTVKYDYNDGTGSDPVSDVVNAETTPDYTIKSPTKDADIFKGWMFTDPYGEYWWTNGEWDNGRVSVINPGQTLRLSGDITFYAKWDYYVHYNNGTGYTHDVVRNGAGYTIASPSGKNGDKEFVCWEAVSADGTISVYHPGDKVDLTSDMTLSAVWSDPTAGILAGDINGDYRVNNRDLLALQGYLAGADVKVVSAALDVNGDGTVNSADLTRLHQYLTGFDVEICP